MSGGAAIATALRGLAYMHPVAMATSHPGFPGAVKIGPNANGYAEGEIEAYMEARRVNRAAEPDARAAPSRNACATSHR